VTLPGRGVRSGKSALTNMADVIADVAKHHADDASSIALFGHSIGALIAFEFARLLRRENRTSPVQLFVSACHAPHIPPARPAMHELPDAPLVDVLRRLGGTPPEVLASSKLRAALLRPYRADLAVYETYRYSHERPFSCPISAFAGMDDAAVTYADLSEWRRHTEADCTIDVFPGDHFYLQRTDTGFLSLFCRKLNALMVMTGDRPRAVLNR